MISMPEARGAPWRTAGARGAACGLTRVGAAPRPASASPSMPAKAWLSGRCRATCCSASSPRSGSITPGACGNRARSGRPVSAGLRSARNSLPCWAPSSSRLASATGTASPALRAGWRGWALAPGLLPVMSAARASLRSLPSVLAAVSPGLGAISCWP
ncbi:hypothetical protein G6F54_013806 [Rhizopus delemar]|nr:hypothetical protein G6F54_013806 [Rhizopus delemar]